MANVRNGNTFYIDTQYSVSSDELAIPGIRVAYITVSSTSASNLLTLADSNTGFKKITIQNIDAGSSPGDTRNFDYRSYPISFPNGIRPLTVTNLIATLVLIDPRS